MRLSNKSLNFNPAHPVPFRGQESISSLLVSLLRAKTSVISVFGSHGVGLTRLCLEVAAQTIWFKDRRYHLDCEALNAKTFLQQLKLLLGVTAKDWKTLGEKIDQPALLVLDHFDHLIASDLENVLNLIESAHGLQVLISSHRAIENNDLESIELLPLEVPAQIGTASDLMECAAYRLFVDYANSVAPSLDIAPRFATQIQEICLELDGMPHAILLAAQNMLRVLPEALLLEIRNGDDVRAVLPDGGLRHTSVLDTFERTWVEFDDSLKLVLSYLSMFVGGSYFETLETTMPDLGHTVLEQALLRLQERRWIRNSGDSALKRFNVNNIPKAVIVRFLKKTGELEHYQKTFANTIVNLIEYLDRNLESPEQLNFLKRFEIERSNTDAVLRWADQHDAKLGFRLASLLTSFWVVCGDYKQGCIWLENFVRQTNTTIDKASGHLVYAWQNLGELFMHRGLWSAAESWFKNVLEFGQYHNNPTIIGAAFFKMANVAYAKNDLISAELYFEQSLGNANQKKIVLKTAYLWIHYSAVFLARGQVLEAEQMVSDGLNLFRGTTNLIGQATAICRLAAIQLQKNKLEEALKLFAQSKTLFDSLGYLQGQATALIGIGQVAQLKGQHQLVLKAWLEAVVILHDIDCGYATFRLLEMMVDFLFKSAAIAQAAQICGLSDRYRNLAMVSVGTIELHALTNRRTAIRQVLKNADALFEAGEKMAEGDFGAHLNALLNLPVAREVPNTPASQVKEHHDIQLSQRESEVLELLVEGNSNKKIARALSITDHTVKYHLASLFSKFGVQNRTQATKLAIAYGLVKNPGSLEVET
jgi:DNA-binding CsgD family transcriptional regulator